MFNKDYIFVGPIVHSTSLDDLEIISKGYIAVKNGKIVSLGNEVDLPAAKLQFELTCGETVLSETQFLIPGFIDCHIHAPQMPNVGLGYDKPLLEWLEKYTFPLECEYKDVEFAKKVYNTVVSRTLACGTTTATYFATIHKDSTFALAKVCHTFGQRALVGKVNMNATFPSYYRETTENSIKDTIDFIESVSSLEDELIQPIITPRFALSCDMDLMKKLADIAKSKDLHIQSHISENLGEIQAVKDTYCDNSHYTDVYEQANLLTNKCVMAHAVHLEDAELPIFRQRGTSIAHCPSSNTCLSSGLCNVRRLLNAEIKVGLGTDISGGSSLFILDVMRRALDVSIHLTHNASKSKEDQKPLNYKNVFYLATLGGAKALSLDNKIGNFEVGKDFDALLIDTDAPGSLIDIFDLPENLKPKTVDDKIMSMLQKLIYVGDDRNISKVFVKGRQVKNISTKIC